MAEGALRHVLSTPSVMDALADVPASTKQGASVLPSPTPDSVLGNLSDDLVLLILSLCSEADLLDISCVSRWLRALVETPNLWETKIRQRHGPVVRALFGNQVPHPVDAHSWKQHGFEFDRIWLELARKRTGRVLLRMQSNCCASSPSYLGVPPARDTWLYLRVPGFGMVLPIRIDFFAWWSTPTFGVYDATDFVDQHPGAEQLLYWAALEEDCTLSFDAANHSERARLILRKLVVPNLQTLRPLPPLARPRPSAWSKWRARAGLICRACMRDLLALPGMLWHVAVARAVTQLATGGLHGKPQLACGRTMSSSRGPSTGEDIIG